MRRDEFSVADTGQFEDLMARAEYGTLALSDEYGLYAAPVNFVWFEESICFHGATEGRKALALKEKSPVAFSVVEPHAMLPSYFSGTRMACPATQCYISAHIQGVIEQVHEEREKCMIFSELMQKFQPEGGYEPIEEGSALYKTKLAQTAIWRIWASSISVKAKMGQNFSEERKKLVLQGLSERQTELDIKTKDAIEYFNDIKR